MSHIKHEIDVSDATLKSTLPPRKRAKTKEEKEQRRVERILRNRRAAHASREKKRKHVEYLESYVVQLEQNLSKLQENFDMAFNSLENKAKGSLQLHELMDISQLKSKIHANLSRESNESGDSAEACELNESGEPVQSESNESPDLDASNYKLQPKDIPESETSSNSISEDNSVMSLQPDSTYFNYLSPISINSPIHTPIDLTLTNKWDGLEQNSAVILRVH